MQSRTLVALALLCSAAAGQASFDVQAPACTYAFPTSCVGGGDPEGVVFNGVLTFDTPTFGATVGAANGLGMPCGGSQFLRLQCANGNIGTNVPAGGPISETGTVARLFIPIPSGATAVSFCWDFYTAEYVNSAFNDAVAVDVVSQCGAGGTVLSPLVYADTHSPGLATVTDSTPCGVIAYIPAAGVHELAAPSGVTGPQSVVNAPLPPGSAYLRVSAANGFDNAATSQIVIDSVTFAGAGGSCSTVLSSPFGPGSVMLANTPCPGSAGRTYFNAVDLTAGSYPAGWFFGLDISIPEIFNLIALGFPFTGMLDGSGASTSGGFGPTASLSGLTLFVVTTEWTSGFGAFLGSRSSVAYTIP
jgi:hypothetical protein